MIQKFMICNLEKITYQKRFASRHYDVRDVTIVCRDHISCVFDGLSNANALGIPADGTADEKLERVFCLSLIHI